MDPEREIVVLVNPRAGWGGLLGVSGSDDLVLPSLARGPAHRAMVMFLRGLERVSGSSLDRLPLITAPGLLGEHAFFEAQGRLPAEFEGSPIDYDSLLEEARIFMKKTCRDGRLLVFAGGDGTAFEAAKSWNCGAPLLGVPGGSKMYSSVFALSPSSAALGAWQFLRGDSSIDEGEVILVDEKRLASGEWVVVEHLVVPTIGTMGVVRQASKEPYAGSVDEVEMLAAYLVDILEEGIPTILGPGGLMGRVARFLGWVKKAFAGFAAGITGYDPYCQSCSSTEIYKFVNMYKDRVKIILSVLGRSGFLLGRATRALTPSSLALAGGVSALLVASPPSKLAGITSLKVDSAYKESLGSMKYLRVLTSPDEYWVKKIEYV